MILLQKWKDGNKYLKWQTSSSVNSFGSFINTSKMNISTVNDDTQVETIWSDKKSFWQLFPYNKDHHWDKKRKQIESHDIIMHFLWLHDSNLSKYLTCTVKELYYKGRKSKCFFFLLKTHICESRRAFVWF